MPAKNTPSDSKGALATYKSIVLKFKILTYAAIILAAIAIVISVAAIIVASGALKTAGSGPNQTLTTTMQGSTGGLAGIGEPLNTTQLAVINSEPNSYFQKAGLAYLNGSLNNRIYPSANKVVKFTFNNKTSVIYLGSITCIFCAENRWAMALALSRFGNFTNLFKGYSALNDGDVPTLFWTPLNYNISSDAIGNFYSSKYVNFLSIEDTNPITGGFVLNPPSVISTNIASSGNATYSKAFAYIQNLSTNKTTAFQGTPYTVWGAFQFSGADAVVFGNTTPTTAPQMSSWSHAQIINLLSNVNNQFSLSEYAAADVYVAAICASMSNSTQASIPACSLPAVKTIAAQFK